MTVHRESFKALGNVVSLAAASRLNNETVAKRFENSKG